MDFISLIGIDFILFPFCKYIVSDFTSVNIPEKELEPFIFIFELLFFNKSKEAGDSSAPLKSKYLTVAQFVNAKIERETIIR